MRTELKSTYFKLTTCSPETSFLLLVCFLTAKTTTCPCTTQTTYINVVFVHDVSSPATIMSKTHSGSQYNFLPTSSGVSGFFFFGFHWLGDRNNFLLERTIARSIKSKKNYTNKSKTTFQSNGCYLMDSLDWTVLWCRNIFDCNIDNQCLCTQ